MKVSTAFFLTSLSVLAVSGSVSAQETAAVSSSPFAVTLIMRWIHILSAITMMGGAVFTALILRSAVAEALDEPARAQFVAAVRKRWKRAVHLLTALLLISGFYNYLMVTRFQHPDEPAYHMAFGIKFLLSLAVFALAAFLVGGTGLGKRLQANEGLWLTVLLVLAAATVMIGGFMKIV